MDQVEVVEETKVESNDPWALIKSAKTREERKALYAQITAAKRESNNKE
jgi:hypothetical protein